MPTSMPSAALSDALEAIGIDIMRQHKGALRGFVHKLTGTPPADKSTADDLARTLLTLAAEKGAAAIEEAIRLTDED